MLFTTPTQWVALALALVAGWLLGLASHPGGKKWKARYLAERDTHAELRRTHQTRIGELERDHGRVAELERENARLVERDRERERLIEQEREQARLAARDHVHPHTAPSTSAVPIGGAPSIATGHGHGHGHGHAPIASDRATPAVHPDDRRTI